MAKPLIVIKLGGSALTDKTRIYTPRKTVIRRAAKQVAYLARKFSIVLVHGAGSYGHIPAKKWDLASGFKHKSQLAGLSATKSKLLEWEGIIGEAFLRQHADDEGAFSQIATFERVEPESPADDKPET